MIRLLPRTTLLRTLSTSKQFIPRCNVHFFTSSPTLNLPDDGNQMPRLEKLKYIHQGKGKQAAKQYLARGIKQGKSSNMECVWGMTKLCDTSMETQNLLKLMNKNDIPINETVLNQLIYSFLAEADVKAAQNVIDVDFLQYGLKPDALTVKTMAEKDTMVANVRKTNKFNSNAMKKLLAEEGMGAASNYFNELITNGKANSIHCLWAIKSLCDTSSKVLVLIDLMQTNDVPIDAGILNSLMDKYLFEDKKEEAQRVIDVEFDKYGVEPDHYTRVAMRKADAMAKLGQNVVMKTLLSEKGKITANIYFNELIKTKKVDKVNFSWAMIHLCDNSKEVYELIDLMKENDVPIHQSILNTLIYQLLSEKNQEEAQHVVEVLFDTYGLEPNDRTTKLLKKNKLGREIISAGRNW